MSFNCNMRNKSSSRILLALLLLPILLASSGCGNNDENYLFEVEYAFDIQIPDGQNAFQSLVIPFENLQSKVKTEMSNRGLSEDDIRIVQTSRARIDLVDFDGTLGVLSEVEVNLYQGLNPSVNPYEACYTIQIPDRNLEQLDLVPSLTNLKEILVDDAFNMEMVMSWKRINLIPMNARFSITFGAIE